MGGLLRAAGEENSAGDPAAPMAFLGSLYFSIVAVGTMVRANAMPAWAQDKAGGWILGIPQPARSKIYDQTKPKVYTIIF